MASALRERPERHERGREYLGAFACSWFPRPGRRAEHVWRVNRAQSLGGGRARAASCAVLYEMLAGKPAFSAETAIRILEVISAAALDWGALPRSTPTRIRELLRRRLEGDTKQRLLGYRPRPVRDRRARGRSQLDHITLRVRGYWPSHLPLPSVRSAGGAPRSRTRFIPGGWYCVSRVLDSIECARLRSRAATLRNR
jgi:hypothetical protein